MTPPPRPTPRLMLFDVNGQGHHASYIAHVLHGWRANDIPGRLTAAVSPALFETDPSIRELAGRTPSGLIDFVEMPEAPRVEATGSLLRKGLGERRLLKRYAEALRPDQIVGMYGDHTQFALATGLRLSFPTRVSLVFLRVSHHRPSQQEPWSAPLTRWRKKRLLQAAFRNPHMHVAFSADPTALDAIGALMPGARTALLPDPLPLPTCAPDAAGVRAAYGVDEGRTLLLLFGALSVRKGVLHTLDALPLLPRDVTDRLTVLLAGPVEPGLQALLPRRLADVKRRTSAQILLREAFLFEPEICALMGAADLALLPYQFHTGTSSVLIRAAGAHCPVLGQAYGLMGEQIATHRLGQAVDTMRPEALARGLVRFLEDPSVGFDASSAQAFAESQTPQAYALTLFDQLGLRTGAAPRPQPFPPDAPAL